MASPFVSVSSRTLCPISKHLRPVELFLVGTLKVLALLFLLLVMVALLPLLLLLQWRDRRQLGRKHSRH